MDVTERAVSVFISYAHEDSGVARQVRDSLQEAGLKVFHDSDLAPGDSVSARITGVLQAAGSFVLLLSRHYIASSWSQMELASALAVATDEGRPIVPVLIDPGLELSDLPPMLFDIQWLDARSGLSERQLSNIARVVRLSRPRQTDRDLIAAERSVVAQMAIVRQKQALLDLVEEQKRRQIMVSLLATSLAALLSIVLGLFLQGPDLWSIALSAVLGAGLTVIGSLLVQSRLARRRRG